MTSSPSCSVTGRPSSSHEAAATASMGRWSSPAVTGSSGELPMNPVATSVPPDSDPRTTSGPTASYTQRYAAAGSGEPVGPDARSPGKAWALPRPPAAFLPGEEDPGPGAGEG